MSRKKKKKRSVRKGAVAQRAEYMLYRVLVTPLRAASFARLDRWSARAARLMPSLLRWRHQLALQNLARVFPEKTEAERREIATRCWRFFTSVVFRFINTASTPDQEANSGAVLDRPEILDGYLAQGRPVIVLTAHIGDWERALHAFNRFDAPVTVVFRRLDNLLLENHLFRARLRANVELADRRNAARILVRALERPGIIIIMADQGVRPRDGILVPFLGSDAWTTPAPAKLALRANAPIAFVFARDFGTPLVTEVAHVIDPLELAEEDRTPERLTRMINDTISARILERPELWLWMHDRWKAAPPPDGAM